MAASGSGLLSVMMLAKYLILSSTVLQTHLLLYQTQRFQFVDTGEVARLVCTSTENFEDDGLSLSWYKSGENRILFLIWSCLVHQDPRGKFACKREGRNSILEIFSAQVEDSGIYICGNREKSLSFSNESSLLVGDSYTANSWVMVFLPPEHEAAQTLPRKRQQLACVVRGVSNFVQVSWLVPVGFRREGQTVLMGNSSGFLTFLSVLHVPMNLPTAGKVFACQVRFNSSGTSLQINATFPITSSAEVEDHCLHFSVPLAVLLVLALLMVLLGSFWIRLYPSMLGFPRPQVSEPPTLEMSQEDVCYAQLDFASRTLEETQQARRKHRDLNNL